MKKIYLLAPIFLLGCTQLSTKEHRRDSMRSKSAERSTALRDDDRQYIRDRDRVLKMKARTGFSQTAPNLSAQTMYEMGLAALKNGQYGQSLKIFSQISEKYSDTAYGSKALWAKGIVFKRMNLGAQASEVWTQLRLKYPKSREAKFASAEMQKGGVRR